MKIGIILEKLKQKDKKYYIIDWIIDIALIIAFIYLSLMFQQYTAQCSNCIKITGNGSMLINGSVSMP